MILTRRTALATLGATSLLLPLGRAAFAAAPTRRRLLFILQRGAADGLDLVQPYGDPGYARLRAATQAEGEPHKLDGLFRLHPALSNLARLYAAKQALFVNAIASPYRDRSHFDGQNLLELGSNRPYARPDGWLNRLAALAGGAHEAIALAPTIPLALRGPAAVDSFSPSRLPPSSDDLLARVGRLYASDAQLAPLWQAAVAAEGLAGGMAGGGREAAATGVMAAQFLGPQGSARIAMIETGGWDTHNGQRGRLAAQARHLDTLIASFEKGMGSAWADTIVLIATEFGRTAAVNGTGGTDHGTAGVAMVVGGAVRGGRVIADWPGLATATLYQGRDLKPTADLFALFAGVAAATLGRDPAEVALRLFPHTPVKPLTNLI